nr:SPOR domain-containing protein [Thauera linaloolentis]
MPAPADGYRIQLGVFGDSANALSLQRELAARGLPAGIQSRVVLGPFADREAARKAQSALRAEGLEAGMLLPPAKKKP